MLAATQLTANGVFDAQEADAERAKAKTKMDKVRCSGACERARVRVIMRLALSPLGTPLRAAVGYASCSLASSHVGLHRRRPISQRARLSSNKRRLRNRQFLILEEVPAVGSPHLRVRDLSFMVARANNLHP